MGEVGRHALEQWDAACGRCMSRMQKWSLWFGRGRLDVPAITALSPCPRRLIPWGREGGRGGRSCCSWWRRGGSALSRLHCYRGWLLLVSPVCHVVGPVVIPMICPVIGPVVGPVVSLEATPGPVVGPMVGRAVSPCPPTPDPVIEPVLIPVRTCHAYHNTSLSITNRSSSRIQWGGDLCESCRV